MNIFENITYFASKRIVSSNKIIEYVIDTDE